MSKLFEQLRQLERLDQLIRMKATGSPKDLARRMEVSERTIYNLLDNLRLFGAEIRYCRMSISYYYQNNLWFRFDFILKEERDSTVKGGYSVSFFLSNRHLNNIQNIKY